MRPFRRSVLVPAMLAITGLAAIPAGADDRYLGDIFIMSTGFCPMGSAKAEGQLLGVGQAEELFALLGTTYGGDGVSTFGLPDFRGRKPVVRGTLAGSTDELVLGEKPGAETVTLTPDNLPPHQHMLPVNITGPSHIETVAEGFDIVGVQPGQGTTFKTGDSMPVSVLDPALAMQMCIVISGLNQVKPAD